jgi:hypothetical protein
MCGFVNRVCGTKEFSQRKSVIGHAASAVKADIPKGNLFSSMDVPWLCVQFTPAVLLFG